MEHAAAISSGGDPVVLRLVDISKAFPGVKALDHVSFDLKRGEVHALCGENGAGKSTLMKILSGLYQPDTGAIELKGEQRRFASPRDSEGAGIAIIYQELNLVPHLSVAENIFLAREPRRGPFVDRKKLAADAAAALARVGLAIDPGVAVGRLSVAQRQMVEIAKALSLNAEVLIMDEPTSSLTEAETSVLFSVMRQLKARGVSIVYISHRLGEMEGIVDRVTVLRDGRHVATHDFSAITIDEVVALMVGRPLDQKFPDRVSKPTADVLLTVTGLTRPGVFADVSFDLKRGEILGFAGLMGAGRTEVARAIFGADGPVGGEIRLGGRKVSITTPREAIREGIAYLSEDRKRDGLAIKMSVAANVTLPSMDEVARMGWLIDFPREAAVSRSYVDLLDIRTPSIDQVCRLLSGGNQQKVVIAKWLFRKSKILFFDEPTRGIDVGAKYAIHKVMDGLAADGVGVVLISSELPEIMGMTDRVVVFHAGRAVAVLETARTSQEEIMSYAAGHGRRNG